MFNKEHPLKEVIKSLGLVFGDIGTSPIYTLTVVFLMVDRSESNVIGVLSLIVWTLILLVFVEYSWLAMSISKKGEGGTIVLREVLLPMLKKGRRVSFITFLSFIGISLLVGDGVITPAISILSAVEGIALIPHFEEINQDTIIIIAAVIATLLFLFQRKGTERVGAAFGPIMLIWFLFLSVSGIISIQKMPSVIRAINPFYGLQFLAEHGIAGFFVLSKVILCATGGEALYADMGHLGRRPIVRAWYFVFGTLLLSYLGQGAFLIRHPEVKNVLFEMISHQAPILYIPFLIISIAATVIASQAMISGMFSICYQAITTRIIPLLKVDYTSTKLKSQIYIGAVNWFLLAFVLLIMFVFRESSNLAAAYGLAVTGDMTITGIMLTWIFWLKGRWGKSSVAFIVAVVDFIFLLSNLYKLPHGGYWSIIISSIPLCLIIIYTYGNKKMYKSLRPMPLESFLDKYNEIFPDIYRIRGTALFFARDINMIPPYIFQTMFINNIIYTNNIIVSIVRLDEPYGVISFYKDNYAEGLAGFEILLGYMEIVDVEELLKVAGIEEKAIFYGLEEIATRNFFWTIFSIIKRLTPSYVQFYKLPSHKLHGVITRVEM